MAYQRPRRAVRFGRLLLVFVCCHINSTDVTATLNEQKTDLLAQQIIAQSGISGGLVVHVGCTTGELTAALRINDRYVVQGLARKAADVEQARDYIQKHGDYGSVTVTPWGTSELPYIDNLVNLLVADKAQTTSTEEILRVLSPGGVAILADTANRTPPEMATRHEIGNMTWWKLTKPWPANVDQWTHYLHGPDNNAVARDTAVGPPRQMQWAAGPRWARNHHILASVSSAVTADGRIFAVVDDAPSANINIPGHWAIVARNAFSGVTLWKKPMQTWAWHRIRFRSGPPQVPRLLVASADRLFCPLSLNAPISTVATDTGQTLDTFPDTEGAEEILLVGRTLIVLKGIPVAEHAIAHTSFRSTYRLPNKKILLALDADTGKTLWQWSDPTMTPLPETLAADATRVFMQCAKGVIALDLRSGTECWRYEDQKKQAVRKRISFGKHTLVVADGVVLCKLASQLTAISAQHGTKLWDCPAGSGFRSPLDIFVIDGLVWQGDHEGGSISPPPATDFHEGRDLHTGKVTRTNRIAMDLQTVGHHHRCYREKATSRFIITGKRGIEMMDLVHDDHSRNNWVRGGCQYGVLPANGLLYSLPHACGCYMESMIRGFWALAAERSPDVRQSRLVPDAQRLERGSAAGSLPSTLKTGPEDWPVYRHDPLRSGIASTRLPTHLTQAWKTVIGGKLTQPVIACGRVVLASIDAQTVFALDQRTGKLLWQFVAGGRVDSPPTILDGRVLFGSADGRITCLDLNNGAMIWRFLASTADVRAVAFDQVESVWPMHGSPLVLNGVVYCSAGRSTWLDGGIRLFGLDPATGAVLHTHHFESSHPEHLAGKDKDQPDLEVKIVQNLTDYKTFHASDQSDAFSMKGSTVSDVLVSDGTHVFLHHIAFDTKLNRLDQMKRHLFSTSSLLDDAENHRSHWVLGTGDFSRVPVAYSWIANGRGKWSPKIAVPTAVMMAFNGQSLWGIRRQKGDSTGKYLLFAKTNRLFTADEKPLPDFRHTAADDMPPDVWQRELPVRPTAILAAGDCLYLSTAPIEIPADDPNAAYEGRLGGSIWVCAQQDGQGIAKIELASPAVWDGMAAASGMLFLATTDGSVICLK